MFVVVLLLVALVNKEYSKKSLLLPAKNIKPVSCWLNEGNMSVYKRASGKIDGGKRQANKVGSKK